MVELRLLSLKTIPTPAGGPAGTDAAAGAGTGAAAAGNEGVRVGVSEGGVDWATAADTAVLRCISSDMLLDSGGRWPVVPQVVEGGAACWRCMSSCILLESGPRVAVVLAGVPACLL